MFWHVVKCFSAGQTWVCAVGLCLAVAALGADAVCIEGDTAQGASVDFLCFAFRVGGKILFGCAVDAACEGDFGDVQLVLQEGVNNLYHAFDSHCLFGDNKSAIGIGCGKLRLEGFALHLVLGCAVLDALCLVDCEDGRKKGVVLTEDE